MRRPMLLLALPLAACSMGRDVPAADQAATGFHQALNAGRIAQIYIAAAPDLRAASTAADFGALAAAVHRKLGQFRSARTTGWRENVDTNGTFVDLGQATRYDGGEASEEFVFRIADGRATLAGWHINSNALILH